MTRLASTIASGSRSIPDMQPGYVATMKVDEREWSVANYVGRAICSFYGRPCVAERLVDECDTAVVAERHTAASLQ